jgi:hypothetical protein
MALTEDGTCQQLTTQPKFLYTVQTNTAIYYGCSELPGEEKSKSRKKKFSLLLKMEIS